MNVALKVVAKWDEPLLEEKEEDKKKEEPLYMPVFYKIIEHLQELFPHFPRWKTSYLSTIHNGVVDMIYGSIHIRFPADMEFDEVNVPVAKMWDWEITPSNSTCQSVADILSSQNAGRGSVGRSTRAIVLTRKSIKIAENDE